MLRKCPCYLTAIHLCRNSSCCNPSQIGLLLAIHNSDIVQLGNFKMKYFMVLVIYTSNVDCFGGP